MVLEALMDFMYSCLSALLVDVEIPSLPEELYTIFDELLSVLSTGYSLLVVYFDMPFLLSLMLIVLSVDVGLYVFYVALWIFKKVPFLNVS